MTHTRFGEQACHKVRAKLDAYIDNELLTESNLEILEHFKRCETCPRDADERRDIRRRLQEAVQETPIPAGLEQRIRDRLRQPNKPQPNRLILMAIAAALALCFGVIPWSDSNSALFRLAFDDHVHCAVLHHPAPRVPGRPNQLPAPFTGLAETVAANVPSQFALILAHECHDRGRMFVHLTYGDGQHLLSVILTRRADGESLGSDLHRAARDRYQLAATETGQFLVYTVSDLSAQENAKILAGFAPRLHEVLARA